MKKERLCRRICNYILSLKIKSLANLTRDAIADEFDIPPSSLSTMFKQKIGIKIGEYINSTRINKAENLIKNRPDLTIENISKIVGIEKTQVFRNKFKEKFGINPGEYRKLYQK